MTKSPASQNSAAPRTRRKKIAVPDAQDPAHIDIAEYLRDEDETPTAPPVKASFAALTIGAVGVVYGDIGTSPLYAFRESLKAAASDAGMVEIAAVFGILSLLIWALLSSLR